MSRIKVQNCQDVRNSAKYCIYLLRNCFRISYNYSLLFAIESANKSKVPLLVLNFYDKEVFNERQRVFLLQGLLELKNEFKKFPGLKFVTQECRWDKMADTLLKLIPDASEVVMDEGYMREDRSLLKEIRQKLIQNSCRLTTVENNLVVPVETASSNSEYAARTFRPKIWHASKDFLISLPDSSPSTALIDKDFPRLDPALVNQLDLEREIIKAQTDCTVKPHLLVGGEKMAKSVLEAFITTGLDMYSTERNFPGLDRQSNLSAYLRFGMISPVEVILEVRKAKASKVDKDDFIEELLVRRELSYNFVWHEPNEYDSLASVPQWAKITMKEHEKDQRQTIYNFEELEHGKTYDDFWNAAQLEMVNTGKMHGYMRMYWAKKVIEWTENYEVAYKFLMEQNDKYQLDGRDPNGFAGVLWNFGKHDKAHAERAIFGKLRYMNAEGIKRKFKKSVYEYVKKNCVN